MLERSQHDGIRGNDEEEVVDCAEQGRATLTPTTPINRRKQHRTRTRRTLTKTSNTDNDDNNNNDDDCGYVSLDIMTKDSYKAGGQQSVLSRTTEVGGTHPI